MENKLHKFFKIMKAQQSKLLVLVVLLVSSMIASLILTQQSQELRRGAAGGFRQYFEPTSVKIKVAETIKVKSMVEAGKEFDSASVIICYPDYIEKITDVTWGANFSTKESLLSDLELIGHEGERCAILDSVIGQEAGAPKSNGIVELATITLKGLKAGSGGSIKVIKDVVTYKNSVGETRPIVGEVSGSFDPDITKNTERYSTVGTLAITVEDAGKKYVRGACDAAKGTYTCTESDTGTMDLATCQATCETTKKYTRGTCNYSTGEYNCTESGTGTMTLDECKKADSNCYLGYAKTTNCNTTTGDWECQKDATSTVSLDKCKAQTGCDIVNSESYVLRFKIVYPGVRATGECAEEYKKLSLIVEAPDGKTLALKDVVAVKIDGETKDTGEDKPLQVYKVEVPLKDFNYSDNLSVVVKGVKHLGVRFGVDAQKACYNKTVGQLSKLTKDSKSPLFDFTGMPLLAGDVGGPNSGLPDDFINAVDYTLIKNAQNCAKDKCPPQTDLNGDCAVNSADSVFLTNSLSEKCGGMY